MLVRAQRRGPEQLSDDAVGPRRQALPGGHVSRAAGEQAHLEPGGTGGRGGGRARRPAADDGDIRLEVRRGQVVVAQSCGTHSSAPYSCLGSRSKPTPVSTFSVAGNSAVAGAGALGHHPQPRPVLDHERERLRALRPAMKRSQSWRRANAAWRSASGRDRSMTIR